MPEELNDLRVAAEQGDADAQFRFGNIYYRGNGVPQSSPEAAKWFRKAAMQGHVDAISRLAFMYKNGHGVPWNEEMAEKLHERSVKLNSLREAAERGDAEAQFRLGDIYYEGKEVSQDHSEALKWFRKAAEQGHAGALSHELYQKAILPEAAEQGDAEAQFRLGSIYYQGRGVPLDHSEALKWLRKAAEQGHAGALSHELYQKVVLREAAERGDIEAQFRLGSIYYQGRGVSLDYSEALKWLRKAAERGHADAQFRLGIIYYQDRGVPLDYSEALKWLRKAAEQGHVDALSHELYQQATLREAAEQGDADAQFRLGSIYYEGKEMSQDYSEALKWFRKAAEQGHAGALSRLGFMYKNGYGVPQDDAMAYKSYRTAAGRGDARAQLNVGIMYLKGKGVQQDKREAVYWYRKAAEQGNANAQFNLGAMYYKGEGVQQDRREAYIWIFLAARAAEVHFKAQNALREIARQITPAQIAAAREEAALRVAAIKDD